MKAKELMEKQSAEAARQLVEWPLWLCADPHKYGQVIEMIKAIVDDIESLRAENEVLRGRIKEIAADTCRLGVMK